MIVALDGRFRDRTIWMKISELARYWAAKELTRIERSDGQVKLTAPLACPRFTLRIPATGQLPPAITHKGAPVALAEAHDLRGLKPGTWLRQEGSVTVCFDLPKGQSVLTAR